MAYQDLLKDASVSIENGNYFIVTVTDLELNQSYPIQLRWKYKDGTYGLWSATKVITTPGETLPGTPDLPVGSVTAEPGLIKITWNGNDAAGRAITNIDRVDIYIDGFPFDGSKPAGSFKTAGTQTIAAPAGEYAVALYAISNYGSKSAVSLPRTVLVPAIGETVISPEDPDVPIVTAGLASVIVEWNGKRLNQNAESVDFTKGSFAGAKVFIGTSAGFTPSNDNWVHTLNFANGSNKVSIGVGTIINKSTGATLEYNTPYYVKIDTVNANGIANGQPVSADGNPITVSRLPASEIDAGILRADAYIQAGANGGQRVVLSGGSSPFIIYGTDGTTKLLEYLTSGTTGTLAIKGSGTFTGDLSIGSGNDIFKADPDIGIWLGNANYASAPFRVNKSGFLSATYGDIGGWSIAESYLQNSTGTFKINSGTDPSIYLGNSSGNHIRLSPDSMAHYNGGSPTGKFTLTTSNGNLTLSGTITGSSVIGSTIQQGSSGNYILMDQSNRATIKFYNTGFNLPGSISTESFYGGTLGQLIIEAPSNGTESNRGYMSILNTNQKGYLSLGADQVNIDGVEQFIMFAPNDGIQIQGELISKYGGPSSPGPVGVRNVWTVPTTTQTTPYGYDGQQGDLWFSY